MINLHDLRLQAPKVRNFVMIDDTAYFCYRGEYYRMKKRYFTGDQRQMFFGEAWWVFDEPRENWKPLNISEITCNLRFAVLAAYSNWNKDT